MNCSTCDNTGWVCENHDDRPWNGGSDRHDACGCGPGKPCKCNPHGTNERILASVICGCVPCGVNYLQKTQVTCEGVAE